MTEQGEYIWSAEGQFSFETVVCQLLRSDIGVQAAPALEDNSLPDMLFLHDAAISAKHGLDSAMMTDLPEGLSPETEARLFHERVHYWQLIASPVLQYRFTHFLDRLAVAVAERGGRPDIICTTILPYLLDGEEEEIKSVLDHALSGADADFAWVEIEPEAVLGFNQIDAPQPTFQLFFQIPFGAPLPVDAKPAYGAGLLFDDGHDVAHIPFTGLALLESAAYLSQCLFEGKPLPQVEHLDNKWDRRYLGCWEYWRRLHGQRYDSERELALGFLAAVDLAMLGDLFYQELPDDQYFKDNEFTFEMVSTAYRFGKLAYRAQGFDPLHCAEGEDVAEAVYAFQEACCRASGWPLPDVAARTMAVALTRTLVQGCLPVLERIPLTTEAAEEIQAAISWLFEESVHTVGGELERLRPLWSLLSHSDWSNQNRIIGKRVLGMMLNACWDRLHHPGQLAVPHAYSDALTERFSLPFLLLDGRYYLDRGNPGGFLKDVPYPINAVALSYECIQLLPLVPLLRGALDCGMIDPITHTPQCLYTEAGLGCPWLARHLQWFGLPGGGLTDEQRHKRAQWQLDDWCHWTFAALQTHIAPEEVEIRWQERWKQAAESDDA